MWECRCICCVWRPGSASCVVPEDTIYLVFWDRGSDFCLECASLARLASKCLPPCLKLLFYCWDKPPQPRHVIAERVYLACSSGVVTIHNGRRSWELKSLNCREYLLGMPCLWLFEISKTTPSDMLPQAAPYLLSLQKQGQQLEPGIQIPKTYGGISYRNHRSPQSYKFLGFWGSFFGGVMFMGVFLECMSVYHVCFWYPQRPEEFVGWIPWDWN